MNRHFHVSGARQARLSSQAMPPRADWSQPCFSWAPAWRAGLPNCHSRQFQRKFKPHAWLCLGRSTQRNRSPAPPELGGNLPPEVFKHFDSLGLETWTSTCIQTPRAGPAGDPWPRWALQDSPCVASVVQDRETTGASPEAWQAFCLQKSHIARWTPRPRRCGLVLGTLTIVKA